MSVNPLDLQVNFTQLNHVGKQQSLSKESEVLRQDQASENVLKNSEKDTEDVPETKDLSEGPGKIRDKEKKKNLRKDNDNNEEARSEDNNEEKKDQNEENKEEKVFEDPNLGQNVDIIG